MCSSIRRYGGKVCAAEDEALIDGKRYGTQPDRPFRLAQAFAPEMRKAGDGAIINIARSAASSASGVSARSYVASKTGLVV